MKILKFILKLFLPILFIMLIISFVIKDMVVCTINDEVMKKKISSYVLDNIIDDFKINELGNIENKIRNSIYTKEITEKYVDVLINNIINKDKKILDISNEINLILEKELGNYISKSKKEEIYEYLQNKSIKLEERLEIAIRNNYFNSYDLSNILKIYQLFTNSLFRLTLIIISILDLILLFLIEKKNSIIIIKNSFFITGVLSVIIFGLINYLSEYINKYFMGGWLNNINTTLLLKFIASSFIISIIMYIIEKIIKHCYKKNS